MTEGLKVKCSNCGQIRHETTEHYRPDQTPRGNFLRLIEPWSKWRWSCYDDEGEAISTTPAVMMSCPACSAPLVLNGKLNIVAEPEKPKIQVEINQEKIDAKFPPKSLNENNQERIDSFQPISTSLMEQVVEIVEKPKPKKFRCPYCPKSFDLKIALIGHMRSHPENNKKV